VLLLRTLLLSAALAVTGCATKTDDTASTSGTETPSDTSTPADTTDTSGPTGSTDTSADETCGGDTCADDEVCINDECVEDDFLQGDYEGEPQGSGGGTAIDDLGSTCYELPILPYQVTGYAHTDSVGSGLVHAGDDCNGDAGTAIYSIYEGTVYYAGDAGSWGGLVEVQHTNPLDGTTFYSLYGHLQPSTLQVSAGQVINAGDQLGVLGTSSENGGWAEHLHFSIFTGEHPASGVLKGHVTSLEGYEDPIPWLTANCEALCEGSINAVDAEVGSLTVAGSLRCEGGLEKWSLVLGSTTIFDEFPTTDEVSFEETIDVSAFGDAEYALGLWARPTGWTEGVLLDDTTVELTSCTPEAYEACDDGDVWWFDSCGEPDRLSDSCTSDETCATLSATEAECSENCGNGSLDAGEACDDSDLDGETCETLGYDDGDLDCASDCTFDESDCEHETCGNGSVDDGEDCDDSDLDGETCETLGYDDGELDCSGCSFDESDCCEDTTGDETDYGDFCSGGERDIFTVDGAISISSAGSNPRVTATFEKCSGTAFKSAHDCHVRVGSWDGSSYSSSLDRVSFTWASGSSSETVSWDAWTSASDWAAASAGDSKEFYLICDESGGDWNHWRTEAPITVEKTCD